MACCTGGLLEELATDIDVSGVSVHGATGDETAFNEFGGRIATYYFTVFAGSWFTLVGVDDKVSKSK